MPQAHVLASTSHPKYKLLAGLPQQDQELMLGAAREQSFPAGSVITTQGNPADRLYLLRSGCVRFFYTVPDGRKFALSWWRREKRLEASPSCPRTANT